MNRQYTRAPHRRDDSNGAEISPNAALMIDFDNVTMGIRSNLGHELRKLLDSDIIRGKVSVQRAYADWRRYPQYIVPLSEASIDLIFAPAYGSSKKNATDIRLAIDALELVFIRPEIGTFILLSGDSDFSSLVLKLKEYGKYVIGVGLQESSSDLLVQNCDEYYSYNSISGLSTAGDVRTDRFDPWELCGRALDRMVQRNDVMRSDRLKQVMLELDSSFDEKSHGFSKFNKFLAEAASRDIVRLKKAPNGQYEVSPADGKGRVREEASRPRPSRGGSRRGGRDRRGSEPAAETPARDEGRQEAAPQPPPPPEPTPEAEEPAPEAPEGGAKGDSLRRAYGLLLGAVKSLSDDREPVRDSEVKRRILAEDGSFDEAALGFRKFSRFLKQAHDEGVVDLTQGEDGNYYIAPAEDGAGAGPPARDRGRGDRGGRQGRGRGGRREGRRGGTPREAATEAAAATGAETEEPPAAASGEPSEPGEGRSGGRAPGREARAAERPASRGLGRFRKGSRAPAAAKPSEVGSVGAVGPVDVDDGEAESSAPGRDEASGGTEGGGDEAAGSDDAGRPAASPRRRGGLGRFRRGSRGASGPGPAGPVGSVRAAGPAAASDEASDDGDGGARGAGPAAAGPSGDREIIDHMVRNYPGVGQRTAERLVEEFGSDVLGVIDRDPDRVSALLPEGRARAVLEAREAEREDGDAT